MLKKKVGRLIGVLMAGIAALIGMILFSNYSDAAAASEKIGYVDMETLRRELPDYQSLQQTIKDKEIEYNLYRGSLYQKHQTDLKDLENKYTKLKAGKSDAEKAELDKKLQSEIKKKSEELNAQLSEKFAEIQSYLKQKDQAVWDKVRKLIGEVADDKNISVVLDKNAVYHGGKDLTKDVIEKAKKQAEEESKNSKK